MFKHMYNRGGISSVHSDRDRESSRLAKGLLELAAA